MSTRGDLLQALRYVAILCVSFSFLRSYRLNLTKSSSEMDRMKIMHEYIFGDVLGTMMGHIRLTRAEMNTSVTSLSHNSLYQTQHQTTHTNPTTTH